MSKEKKRPQLSLDELHQLKWLLGGALALLSAWATFYLDASAWWLTMAVIVLVPLMLARPSWAARWPSWAHHLAFPLIVSFFAVDLYTSGDTLPAFLRLDLLLLLYRGTSLRKRRDDLQLVVLGLFVILVAGVLTVSLVFAAQILIFTACTLVFLLVITLADAKATGAAAPPAGAIPAWTRVHWGRLLVRLRAATDGRLVGLAGGLFAGVVGLSALLFMAMPRFELANSLFLDRLITRHTRTGFSDTIRFGDVTDIQQDNSVALRVETPGRRPPRKEIYWRMVVLDEYRAGEFRVSGRLRREGANYSNDFFARGGEGEGTAVWTFYFEPGVSRYLPLAGGFGTLRLSAPTDFRFNRETRVLALRSDPAAMVAYRVTGMRIMEALPSIPPDPAMTGLGLSDSDRAELKKMADEIDGGERLSAAEFAERATKWLAQRHHYSLRMELPPGTGDPLVRWLRSSQPGHCELFAGALAVLARTAGYPARVIAGFKGGEWNSFENYLMVRNSDAHAWCEIYERETGAWRRFDPTPSAGAESSDAGVAAAMVGASDRSWSARFDGLRMLWYRHIVNFDQSSQREALRALRTATQGIGLKLRLLTEHTWRKVSAWWRAPWSGRRVLEFLAGAAAAVALIVAARRARWRPSWRWRARRRTDPVRREAGRWLRRMAESGRLTEEGEVRIRFELQRLRYGRRETWPEPGAVFRRARRLARR